MKKWILGLIFSVVMFTSCQAQRRPNPEERIKQQTEQMTKDLNLDDAQKQQVAKLNEDFAKKMTELRKENNGDREAMRSAMGELRDERNAELKKILTEEQYTKHLELEEKRMEERRNRRQGGNPPN